MGGCKQNPPLQFSWMRSKWLYSSYRPSLHPHSFQMTWPFPLSSVRCKNYAKLRNHWWWQHSGGLTGSTADDFFWPIALSVSCRCTVCQESKRGRRMSRSSCCHLINSHTGFHVCNNSREPSCENDVIFLSVSVCLFVCCCFFIADGVELKCRQSFDLDNCVTSSCSWKVKWCCLLIYLPLMESMDFLPRWGHIKSDGTLNLFWKSLSSTLHAIWHDNQTSTSLPSY